jgi:3-phenylpropionate/trans-cinnamate dioxygenase ferredoxin subunit
MKLVGYVDRARLVEEDFVRLEYPPWNVLVAMVDGHPYAIEDSCNHAGASLAEGPRDGDRVVCPMHGYVFSLKTGELIAPPRLCDAQRTFVTREDGDRVAVYDPFKVDIVGGG